ncbi:5-methyltetrahydropteroyltriglutamate--homocysteine S-methyltransferase [Pseudaeromonas sp. ZJS20]|uniref:5-methyltetrahydropteroyltriglutamate-- homocysteine S-methyltransferase n=1 Tax=Pseudaeromonas aegiceratis TaxID=3153928 RepID=UPI00390C92D4
MHIHTHTLGFPRIGSQRELKWALEAYWAGQLDQAGLLETGRRLRERHWRWQQAAGVDLLPVGDFAWYDQVLTTSLMLGQVPERHRQGDGPIDLDTLFRIARGRAPTGAEAPAAELSKWFNTNYHYLVPELSQECQFQLGWTQLLEEVDEARALGLPIKAVLLGPLSWLWLGKVKGEPFDRLSLLPRLLPVYQQVLDALAARGVAWVQMDEPILTLDLPEEWQQAYLWAYERLRGPVKRLLTPYFGSISHQLDWLPQLAVQGLHLDCSADAAQLDLLPQLPAHWQLSLGVVSGRNIWRADLAAWYQKLRGLKSDYGDRLWLATSCSLLHVPLDLQQEEGLEPEVRGWLAFARQKCTELTLLSQALSQPDDSRLAQLQAYSAPLAARADSPRVQDPAVQARLSRLDPALANRHSPFPLRQKLQQIRWQLPLWPTTTIGSFPQTQAVRSLRAQYRQGQLDAAGYQAGLKAEIARTINEQEALGLDVLVHGEAERTDMVEYFGQQLQGFAFTGHGWVQSYGSRCVKPPLIVGDISRPAPMTVAWSQYAQSLTAKPVKGMLTGPLTILCWSFPREDLPRATLARQLALALRDEVQDLEAAGIGMIQIDEPALREGLPLRRQEWQAYLDWAVEAFKLSCGGVADETQIHTHMCYCEFGDILPAIAALDADVITLETARSDLTLLEELKEGGYPNAIGPGVYDIHSPNVPAVSQMVRLLRLAAKHLPVKHLWVNPDCGLKTRGWPETLAALGNMVEAARQLRQMEA